VGTVVVSGINIGDNTCRVNGYLKNVVRVVFNYLSSPGIAGQLKQFRLVFDGKDNRMAPPALISRKRNTLIMVRELI